MSRLFLVLLLVGCFALPGQSFGAGRRENVLAGKRLFNSYCMLCHGEDGRGGGPLANKIKLKSPVADLTQDKYQQMSVEKLLLLIEGYNRKETLMPKWEKIIPEKNLRSIAGYILMFTQKDIRMRGDARRGREIFRQSCVACHGARGKGNGVLAQVLGVKMIDYTSRSLSKITDEEIITTITNGKGEFMPSWMGTLSSEEIKDVASYIRTMFGK